MDVSFGGGFPLMFSIVPVFISIIFILVIAGIAWNVYRYFKNAGAPRDSAYAKVVAKRMDVRNHANQDNTAFPSTSSSRTYYYITLEFDDGSRREFLDVKRLYGLVVEGDTGYAATQGDWIVDFQRQPDNA
ncbi:DUF2500 domain-containing protein [Paenibacillus sp. TAB 01]|uniref:DUF2500 domain-containing protein n=1 Tax=Paenibacillus sp. TAB 01 TaxID=3368988 RepID=UPI003751F1D3